MDTHFTYVVIKNLLLLASGKGLDTKPFLKVFYNQFDGLKTFLARLAAKKKEAPVLLATVTIPVLPQMPPAVTARPQ
eukprot:CAMPEP_0177686582 /NCGR_PEP_ID=MMETSP0447-20121125/33649_1 /TAXON_ID=0 /ORGANISM="Stygamoeba regulata, Strain BSH-02190019" /LENGTH=76 /DNA_ID=CAMNT_0019196721 /DNA_START=410 /DNA_END=640 /DNA_ORIENTATION=+